MPISFAVFPCFENSLHSVFRGLGATWQEIPWGFLARFREILDS